MLTPISKNGGKSADVFFWRKKIVQNKICLLSKSLKNTVEHMSRFHDVYVDCKLPWLRVDDIVHIVLWILSPYTMFCTYREYTVVWTKLLSAVFTCLYLPHRAKVRLFSLKNLPYFQVFSAFIDTIITSRLIFLQYVYMFFFLDSENCSCYKIFLVSWEKMKLQNLVSLARSSE